jgi:DNA-binding IclR family transcriptional regulator
MPASKYLQRREALICFVCEYLADCGFTPSAVTLSQVMGWPISTCQEYLKRLRREILLPAPSSPSQRRYLKYRQVILELIRVFSELHGYAPSLRWLAAESDLSPTTTRKYLERMRQQGLVAFDEGVPRSIRVKKNSSKRGKIH